jgi:formyltetrahydrofolate-dependent phosphoribosylglycinamide formyltransferase
MVRVAVFASGSGTNLQALIDRLNSRAASTARVALVLSDRADARALARAEAADVAGRVIPVAGRDAAAVAAETLEALGAAGIDIIALAGYLRLVPAQVTQRYGHRILNIHPALLPAFGGKGMFGLRVHRAVLEAGCTVTGATVHFVDEHYDEGKPLVQWPVPVLRGDTPETLAARVLEVEHVLYPLAIEWLARQVAGGDPPERRAAGFARSTGARSFTLDGATAVRAEVRRALELEEEDQQ